MLYMVYIFHGWLFGLRPKDPEKAEKELQQALDMCKVDDPPVLWISIR